MVEGAAVAETKLDDHTGNIRDLRRRPIKAEALRRKPADRLVQPREAFSHHL
jgi:hypothetical protein